MLVNHRSPALWILLFALLLSSCASSIGPSLPIPTDAITEEPAPVPAPSRAPQRFPSDEEVSGAGCPMGAILSDPTLYATRMYSLTQTAVSSHPLDISVAQAANALEQGAFFLDVREPEEWEQAHIAGAHLIPLGELSARLSDIPRQLEVVVICRTGVRGARGRDMLRAAGFTRVSTLAGGMAEWQAQGFSIVEGP